MKIQVLMVGILMIHKENKVGRFENDRFCGVEVVIEGALKRVWINLNHL
jgi:hypothetical protein